MWKAIKYLISLNLWMYLIVFGTLGIIGSIIDGTFIWYLLAIVIVIALFFVFVYIHSVNSAKAIEYENSALRRMADDIDEGYLLTLAESDRRYEGTDTEELIRMARSAMINGREGEAGDCYRELARRDPDGWEAYFFSHYYSATKHNTIQIRHTANAMRKLLEKTLDKIRIQETEKEERLAVVTLVTNLTLDLYDKMILEWGKYYSESPNKMDIAEYYLQGEVSCVAGEIAAGNVALDRFRGEPDLEEFAGRVMLRAAEMNAIVAEGFARTYPLPTTGIFKPLYDEARKKASMYYSDSEIPEFQKVI